MRNLRYTCLALVFNLLALVLKAQTPEIVVNELFNGPTQNDEWTELVVVKDDLDLRNWYIGDNNGTTSSWQEKFRFKNIAFWSHLRAGTIIVIDHSENSSTCKSSQLDVDKSDGYIRICCRNASYFEGGSNGTNSMNINGNGDFIQIVSPTGRMAHAMGFDGDPQTSVVGGPCFTTSTNWTDITGPNPATRPCSNFLFFKSNLVGSLKGVIATAGTLADFSKPVQEFSNPYIDTTSTPFEGIGNGGANNPWLINLRTPKIDSQNVCISRSGGSNQTISFSWLPATDIFPSDSTTGYMVVRNTTGFFGLPENGREYAPNSNYGTGNEQVKVVGLIKNSQTVTYSEIPGPGTFYYRVFAFRYKQTTQPTSFFHPTRGRTYNTTNFIKVNGGGNIVVDTFNDTLCGPGLATLKVKAPVGATVSWFLTATGTNSISTEDSLVFNANGPVSRWVEVSYSALCALQRFEVKVVFDTIDFTFFPRKESVCEGTPVTLSATPKPGYTFTWNIINRPVGVSTSRTDSSAFQLEISSLTPAEEIYITVRARNAEGCLSDLKRDTVKPVLFDPKLLSATLTPTQGDSVLVSFQSQKPNTLVTDWTVINGDIKNEDSTQLVFFNTSDSLVSVKAIIQTKAGGRFFCKVARSLDFKIKPKPIPEPSLPLLKSINNLIITNGLEKNQVLSFDRREVKNLVIFDRWGKKVFFASTYKNDWKPEKNEEGTYFYTAEVKEPDSTEFKKLADWVTIVK